MKELITCVTISVVLAYISLSGGPIPRATAKPENQISFFFPDPKESIGSNHDLQIHVSISEQRLLVSDGGKVIAWSDVTTGAPYSETPTGQHSVLMKHEEYRSTLYDVEMPNALFLTENGIAIHGGHLLTSPASGGCIRIPFDFARWLFPKVTVGTGVLIT